MKAAMITYLTVLAMLSSNSFAVSTSTPLAESYQCHRTGGSNKATSYPLSVKTTGSTYTFEWMANGKTALYGTGVVHPKRTNVITVVFWDPNNPDNYGIELFEVKSDGSLNSTWALQSGTELGTETCTKQ